MSRINRNGEPFLGLFFYGLLALCLLFSVKGPKTSVHLDNGGESYLVRSDWWGLSKTMLPLRRINGEWKFQEKGQWFPYWIDEDLPTSQDISEGWAR